jgi:hypothetical protein
MGVGGRHTDPGHHLGQEGLVAGGIVDATVSGR